MSRASTILQGIDKQMHGLEIAPWFAPLVPRAAGYNAKILDVFDRETLVSRAEADKSLEGRDLSVLEDVDFVGSATEIATLVPTHLHGTFDYIVSSHNFEHLPNPIKFLQGCEIVLRHGGVLSMAVPDRRACFDFFRPNTQLGEWLDAYVSNRSRPTPRQIFDHSSQSAFQLVGSENVGAFNLGVPKEDVFLRADIAERYAFSYGPREHDGYHDSHCTVMTPASLELLLVESRYLGLIHCNIDEISPASGCEFYVRLRFAGRAPHPSAAEMLDQRTQLMRRILDDYVAQITPHTHTPPPQKRVLSRLARKARNVGRFMRGKPAR